MTDTDRAKPLSNDERAELDRLRKAATPGPYYIGADAAHDTMEHRDSGLSLVDTGREGDWPIARLCESANAAYIAYLTPERVGRLLDERDALAAALEVAEARCRSLSGIVFCGACGAPLTDVDDDGRGVAEVGASPTPRPASGPSPPASTPREPGHAEESR